MVAMTLAMPAATAAYADVADLSGCARPVADTGTARVAGRLQLASFGCGRVAMLALVLDMRVWVGWRPLSFAALRPRPPASLEVLAFSHRFTTAPGRVVHLSALMAAARAYCGTRTMRGAVFVSALAAGARQSS